MRMHFSITFLVACLIVLIKCDDSSCEDSSCEDFPLVSLAEIDISRYASGDLSEKQAIARVVDDALHRIGSFRIKNHGLSVELISKLYTQAKEFFDKSDEFKSNYKANSALGSNGWEPLGKVNVAATYNSSSKSDPVESIILWFVQLFNNKQSEMEKYCPPELCETIREYARKSREIVTIIYNIFTLALDLKMNQFELDMNDVNDSSITNYYFNEFRLWNYLDLSSPDDLSDDIGMDYRFGAHCDFSCFNLLRTDIAGLQVKLTRIDNKWYTVNNNDISSDSLIIDIGEVMEMYTSGWWLAPLHRVARLSTKRRLSMVYFVGPNMNTMIDELKDCEKCKQNKDEIIMKKYELPMQYRTHAKMRFGGSFTHSTINPFWL